MDESRSVQALQGLLEISKALGSQIELNALLEVIIKRASRIMDADRTTVFVFDPASQRLWSRVGQGLRTTIIDLPLGSGIAGEVARSRRLENIADVSADPRFNPEFDRLNNYSTRSILCAPILSGEGELLGVIQSINKLRRDAFDQDDEQMMTALSSHVAVALERARLMEAVLEQNRFEESLKVASEIQLGMLPKTSAKVPAGSPFEIAAVLRPAKEVGGDFYDFRRGPDGRLFFCIGDVAGKGVPAALLMAVSRTLFRANASILRSSDEIMTAVNRVLCEESGASMFVTAFCAILDPATGELTFTNAGHNPPILITADGTVEAIPVPPALVLGVVSKYKYGTETVTLQPGSTLYLYTDGFSDQLNRSEELFQVEGIVRALSSAPVKSPAGLIDATLAAVERFASGAPQFDDLAALCVLYRGAVFQGEFGRTFDSLERVFTLTEQFLETNALDSDTRYAIRFAIEEIFTNMVKYNAAGKGELTVRLDREVDRAVIVLIDPDSAEFDPNQAPAVDTSASIETRTPGGLGIHLVRKMMDEVQYTYRDRVSTVTMVKRIEN